MNKFKNLLKQQEEKFIIDKSWLYNKYTIERLTLRAIAKIIGCSETTIRNRLMKYNINFIKYVSPPYTEEMKKLLSLKLKFHVDKDFLYQKYYIEEYSASKIASLLNVSETTIHTRMAEYGFVRRNKSEAKKGKLNPSFGRISKLRGSKRSKEFIESYRHKMKRGENHPHYKNPENRIDPINNQIRNCQKSKQWKKDIIHRDGYKCVICGLNKQLHIDHIKPFALIKFENNIKTLEEAILCKELWDVNNGRTLCKTCHEKTDTYAEKTYYILKELKNG